MCLCGAIDCWVCGPAQGYHVCDKYCDVPCSFLRPESFCIYCGSTSDTEICLDCLQDISESCYEQIAEEMGENI